MIEIRQFINNPASSNCFLIFDRECGDDCLIVDPGSKDCSSLLAFLKQEKLNPLYIFLTHEHFDHCWGVIDLRYFYPSVNLICSSICSVAIQDRKKNLSVFYQQPGFDLKPAEIELEDVGWIINWYNYVLTFFPAQGHSASGVMFLLGGYIFTGDELIKDIRTVTKLKTASKDKLHNSLKLLDNLKGRGLMVCPGHGEMFELDKYELEKAYGKK